MSIMADIGTGIAVNCFESQKPILNFWTEKINRNRTRDFLNQQKLKEMGWQVGVVWECSLRGKHEKYKDKERVIELLKNWILENENQIEVLE
jgi:DNA mismatch endonuclease (patch repair protein)